MRSFRGWGIAAAGAALLAVFGVGVLAQQPKEPKPPPRDGAAERVGERIDEAARAVRKGLREAGEAVRAEFAEIREDVNGMGVEARVYGRLHWDKALTDAELEVEVEEGVTTLTGRVPDAAAKAKAIALARETVGVTRVVDQLSVGAPERPKTPAPVTTPPNP